MPRSLKSIGHHRHVHIHKKHQGVNKFREVSLTFADMISNIPTEGMEPKDKELKIKNTGVGRERETS